MAPLQQLVDSDDDEDPDSSIPFLPSATHHRRPRRCCFCCKTLSYQSANLLGAFLLLLAAVASLSAVSGISSGWAYYHTNQIILTKLPWQPPVAVTIDLGWLKSKTGIQYNPYQAAYVEIEASTAEAFGFVVVGVQMAANLAACFFLVATIANFTGNYEIGSSIIGGRRMFHVAALITGLLFGFSCALYVALAVGMKNATKGKFGDDGIIPRPGWAFVSAMVSALCWGLLTAVASDMPRLEDGYNLIT